MHKKRFYKHMKFPDVQKRFVVPETFENKICAQMISPGRLHKKSNKEDFCEYVGAIKSRKLPVKLESSLFTGLLKYHCICG